MYLSDGNIIHRPPRSRSSHRGGPRNHAGLRGLAGGSPLPDQIVCEARSWLGTIEVPSGSNRGGRVDEIHGLYRGRDYKGTEPAESLAWCVEFAWVVIDRAVRALGGVNVLPGWGDTFANARATMEKAKQRLRVDGVPTVGACFFRVSTSQLNGTGTGGDGKSGHFGIVVGWDGQTLRTIEGNTGDNHNVGEYTYPAATVAKPENQFQFIHTELIPVTVSTTVPPCKPVSLPQPEGGTSVPIVPTSGGAGSTVRRPSDPSSGGSVPPDSGGSSSGGSVPPTQSGGSGSRITRPEIGCRVITLPDSSAVPHFTKLGDLAVAADILGANFSEIPAEKRNGAATTRSGSTGREDFSGVGMFKDQLGNTIWVTSEEFQQYGALREYKLWGRAVSGGSVEPYTIAFHRYTGSSAFERTAQFLSGKSCCPGIYGYQGSPLDPFVVDIEGIRYSAMGPIDLLSQIEKRGNKLPRPILILFKKPDVWTWEKGLQFALQVLNMACSYAGMFNLPFAKDDLFQKLQTAVTYLVQNKGGLTLSGVMHLAQLAEQIAPESVRREINSAKDTLTQYANDIASNVFKPTAAKLGLLQADADRLARTLFQTLGADPASIIARVKAMEAIVLNSSLGQSKVRGVLQNIENSLTVNRIQSALSDGWLPTSLSQANYQIAKVPELANLFLTGAAGQLMPLIPSLGEIAGPIIHKSVEIGNETSTVLQQELIRAVGLSALGVPAGTEQYTRGLFAEITLAGLQQKAAAAVEAGLATFTLPDSVPTDQRDCFAYKITEEHKITVIKEFVSKDMIPPTRSGGITSLTTLFPNVEIRPSTSTPTVPTTPKTPGTTINLPDFFGGTPRITEASSGGGTTGGGTTSGGTSRFSQTSGGTTSTTTTIPTTQREVPRTTTVTPGSSTPGGAIPGGSLPGSGGCPPGYMYINGQCLPAVQKETDRCPPGWHWDDMLWDCVPGTSTYPTKPADPPRIVNCPQGYSWDGEKCVPPPPPPRVVSCPPGYLWDGEKCVPPVQTQSVPPVQRQSTPPVQVQSTPPVQTSSIPPVRTMPVLPGTPTPPVQTSSIPPVQVQPSSGIPSIPRERVPASPGVPDQPSSEGDCGCGCDDPEDCGCSAGLADLWSDMPRTFREFY